MGPWFVVALMILVNLPVDTHRDLYRPPRLNTLHTRPAKVVQPDASKKMIAGSDVASSRNWMKLAKEHVMHSYIYVFEGQATYQGQPCPHASVTVRVETPHASLFEAAVTDADGRYSIVVNLEGAHNDPVDWTMEAYTPDFEKVELSGRRIIMREDSTITVRHRVRFQTASL